MFNLIVYNPGDIVQRVIPDTGYGCIGIIQQSFYESFLGGEYQGYYIVEITQGNSTYAVGSITTWYFGSVELVS